MGWILNGKPIPNAEPTQYGFVYLIEYSNGQKYIGKKNFYSTKEIDCLKNGEPRPNHVEFVNRNRNGKRVKREVVRSESDWRKYKGSCKESKGLDITYRKIIATYPDKLNLTYGELEWLVKFDVLRNKEFLNANIMGKFYEGKIL